MNTHLPQFVHTAGRLAVLLAVGLFGVSTPLFAAPATVWVDSTYAEGSCGGHDWGVDAFATIQAGVTAVDVGGTVSVAAGTFNELVTLTKTVTLHGAQAGNDARTRAIVPESIVSFPDGDFVIQADNVVIDGFTIQGVITAPNVDPAGFGAGIWSNPGYSGTHGGHQILNNIVQGNIAGIALGNDGTIQARVQYNLIRNNNAPGAGSGNGIECDFGSTNALIDNNAFVNNTNASVLLNSGGSANTISNNSADNALAILNLTDTQITGNVLTNPSSSGIYIFGGNAGVTVSGNTVVDPQTAGSAGVYIGNPYADYSVSPNSNVTITGNTLHSTAATYGVLIDTTNDSGGAAVTAYSGPASLRIKNNTLTGTGTGVQNDQLDLTVDGTLNNWGAASGPGAVGPGTGVKVSDLVVYSPWLGAVPGTSPMTFVAQPGSDLQILATAAADGDTAQLAPGTYTGSLNLASALTITGGGAVVIVGDVTLDAQPIVFTGVTFDTGHDWHVTPNGAVQDALDAAPAGTTVHVATGTYDAGIDATATAVTLSAGASPGQVTINGDLTLTADDTLPIDMQGTAPGTGYDQWVVNGAVTLGGATLSPTSTFAYVPGATLVLIDNNLADPVSGTFAGLPNGTTLFVGGQSFVIWYDGGDGNDVVLVRTAVVTGVDVSTTLVTDGTAGTPFTVTIDFSEPMNAGVAPIIEFTPDVASTLALNHGDWPTDHQYVATYDVADADVTVADVVIGVSGAQDLGSNPQKVYSSVTGKFSIDTANPAVTNVTSAVANGTRLIGENIDITVTFDDSVTVDTTSGTPQLQLETGTTDRLAAYTGGSGTATLTFRYTVVNGDAAADLDYRATDALARNGGTIKDVAGNAANLTLAAPGAAGSLGATKNIAIDTTLDLEITNAVDQVRPNELDTIVYTATITNHGFNIATNVVVADALPAGVTLTGNTPSQGSYAAGSWNVGALATDATATLQLTATVDPGTAGHPDIVSTASLTSVTECDRNAANNQATSTIHVPLVNVAVEVTVDNNRPIEGETIHYTITARNGTPDTATLLSIADALPAGVTLTHNTPSQGSYDTGTGLWTVGSLTTGVTATLQLTATVDAGTAGGEDIRNRAAVSAVHEKDSSAANDADVVSIHVPLVDISLAQAAIQVPPAHAPNANEGDTLVFTVTVANALPDYASVIRISDTLPAGLTLVNASATAGSYTATIWSIPTLVEGASATLTLTATVNRSPTGPGGTTLTNTASIVFHENDDDATNNVPVSRSVYIQLADIEIGPMTGTLATHPQAWTIPVVKDGEYRLTVDHDTPKFLLNGCAEVQGIAPLALDQWHYIVCRVTGPGSPGVGPRIVDLLIDGEPVATKTAGSTVTATVAPLLLGAGPAGIAPFGGAMDEVRISQKARSDGWVKTAFNQQADAAAFLAVGAEGPGTTYTYQKTLTVNHLKVGAALTDFPVLVNITNADLRTAANSGHVQHAQGYDIRFTLPDGTVLPHEMERFAGNTGSLIAWVKVSALSATADTSFMIHYGDANVTQPTANPAAVWTDGFAAVHHFATETAGVLPDSSGTGNVATGTDTRLLPLGNTGSDCLFNGRTSVLTLANQATLSPTADFTFEGWFIRRDTAADAWFNVQLTNKGPDAADQVVVGNILDGMTSVGHYTEKGTFNGVTGQWQVGTLAKDEVVTLWVSDNLGVAGAPVTSTMEVLAADQADHDSAHGNHVVGEDDQIAVGLNQPPPSNEKPDFVISGISFASAPVAGAFFTAQVTVLNQGKQPGNAGRLKAWSDHYSTALSAESADTSVAIGVLTVGESKQIAVSLQAPLAAAAHTFRAFADGNDITAEQSEGNNQLAKTYTFAAPVVEKPDFVISSLVFFPAPPAVPGVATAVKATVTNKGLAAGVPGALKAWVDRLAPAIVADSADVTVSSLGVLAPGENTVLTVPFTAAATTGTHTFRAFIDGAGATAEQSEGNNQSTLTYTFAEAVTGKPDFVVSAIAFVPAAPALGSAFGAVVTVRNQGLASGIPGKVRIWLNHPLAAGGEAGDRETSVLLSLATGESADVSFAGLTAPGVAGTYAFRAFVDADNATAESSEGNNQKTRYFTLSAPVVERSDFLITNISFSPASLLRGGVFTAFVTVKNQGLALGDPGTLRVWFDHYAASLVAEMGDAQQPVAPLAPGASVIMVFDGLTAPAAMGTHTFRAFVDADGATTEQSEGNNQKTATYGWY